MGRVILIGAIVGCVLKFASPHRNPMAWVMASMVGAFGAVVGMFVIRAVGFGPDESLAEYVGGALSAAGIVIVYAFVSRRIRANTAGTDEKGRGNRPTILF